MWEEWSTEYIPIERSQNMEPELAITKQVNPPPEPHKYPSNKSNADLFSESCEMSGEPPKCRLFDAIDQLELEVKLLLEHLGAKEEFMAKLLKSDVTPSPTISKPAIAKEEYGNKKHQTTLASSAKETSSTKQESRVIAED